MISGLGVSVVGCTEFEACVTFTQVQWRAFIKHLLEFEIIGRRTSAYIYFDTKYPRSFRTFYTVMAWLKSSWKVGLAFVFCLWRLASGGKLLVIPQDGSHWLSMKIVLEKLVQKGHEIVVVMPEVSIHMEASEHFTVRTYSVSYTKEDLDKTIQTFGETFHSDQPQLLKDIVYLKFIAVQMFKMLTMHASACRQFLYDKELMTFLQESNFDALFTDPVLPCGPIIAEYLSLPSVYFMRGLPCNLHDQATQCPSPVSYVPRSFTYLSDHMTFTEQVKNMLIQSIEFILCHLFF